MACLKMILIWICEFTLITQSTSSVYQNVLKKFDVQPLGDDESYHEKEYDCKEGLNCAYPRDCRDVQQCGATKSSAYRVYPYGLGTGFLVSCDMATRGGGWLVFQRRQDGAVDFYRNWQNYTDGFGNLYGEFWLGLEKIHLLTSQGNYKLLVFLRTYDGSTGYAEYDKFFVSDVTENFRLLVGAYSGNVGNSLAEHNGADFTTRDVDNDRHGTSNCARSYFGGWWYTKCYTSNLNGLYLKVTAKDTNDSKSVCWKPWTKQYTPLQFTEMLLRPVEPN